MFPFLIFGLANNITIDTAARTIYNIVILLLHYCVLEV